MATFSRKEVLLSCIAVAYNNGWAMMPINGKAPIHKGWKELKLDEGYKLTKSRIEKAKEGKEPNIGVLTGRSTGIIVIDVDILSDEGTEDWYNIVASINVSSSLATSGPMLGTFTVKTSKGYHYYFRYHESVDVIGNTTQIRLFNDVKIDVRTTGGQIVFPGSKNLDTGFVYSILDGYNVVTGQATVLPIPDRIMKIIYERC